MNSQHSLVNLIPNTNSHLLDVSKMPRVKAKQNRASATNRHKV